MCDSVKKAKLCEKNQSYVDSKYAQSILCHMYQFFEQEKFADFELISCDRRQ